MIELRSPLRASSPPQVSAVRARPVRLAHGPLGSCALAWCLVALGAGCGKGALVLPHQADAGVDTGTWPPWDTVSPVDSAAAADAHDVHTSEPDTAHIVHVDGDASPDDGQGGAPGEFLHTCVDNDDCYSGYCIEAAQGSVCTKPCQDNASCPDGWSCSQVLGLGDPTFICIPIDLNVCRPCLTEGDCNTAGFATKGLCFDSGAAGMFCTRHCSEELVCPEDFGCVPETPFGPDGPTFDLCIPLTDFEHTCTCTARFVASHAGTVCYRETPDGSCEGDRICWEEGPLSTCTAAEPKAEVCNGIDDDCDGETDEEASDCTTYYQDPDGDGYGLGNGECLCVEPVGSWVTVGGDCNEMITTVNPGVAEACNGIDDNCDGATDDLGALGCVPHYLDKDEDHYGVDGEVQCLCAGADGWAPEAGDCNDYKPTVNPGADESCDSIDNDCDGATDEVDAVDCHPFFLDQDGDGYGVTEKVKCLCGPTGVFLAAKPNDCNDTDFLVHPDAPEICNGADDNCNGTKDEGDPQSMCPQVAHGVAGCAGGICALLECYEGWGDADGDPLNGCECPVSTIEWPDSPGQSCSAPFDLGELPDDGSQVEVVDNIVPVDDEDWFLVKAVDGPEVEGCDTFDLRVRFTHNPGDQFVFDVWQGGCAGADEVCTESINYTMSVNFFTLTDGLPRGECPCAELLDETGDEVQLCSDQSEHYLVRVRRAAGKPSSCATYTLVISNGTAP